jgi:hypothetical protein
MLLMFVSESGWVYIAVLAAVVIGALAWSVWLRR